ncbi:MAG: hypothetical protein WDA14_14500 [Sphaerochaetaceae bacterium]|nr:hypothetical protein [Sphaerochaetaceae bacterium]MDD3670099.1 hypothetical protein [Sphaerochaetaceae bacterium]MDD4259599.1 hypothetical protein [Sphaerochaetaceae bacterium]NLO60412.1 hypothetical protein [Spirochaetales bacterium]
MKYYKALFDEAESDGEAQLIRNPDSPELIANRILEEHDKPLGKKEKGSFLKGFKELLTHDGNKSRKTLVWYWPLPHLFQNTGKHISRSDRKLF